ncbi:MAG: Ppx/GppA phosphatase family protein, partial [Cyanobacteria bacterium J06631_6]
MNQQIIAAIDIGTNSIHMVIVQIDPTLPSFTVIAKEKDTVRLGDRHPATGELTPEAIKRSLNTLRRCKELATSLKAEQIIAVATSATREAPNGTNFLRQIESELGIVVNLISGKEEARRIYLGVLSGMDFNDQPHIVIDIGGGSTEIILADVHEARFLSSTKIGAVRLAKEFVTTDPISDSELKVLRAYVRGMLERPVDEIWRNLQLNEVPRTIGTSGTIETIAEIHAKDELGAVPDPLNGYEIGYKDIEKIVKRLAKMSYKQRLEVSGLADKRAEIIVPGAVILLEAMQMLKLDSIVICERALREGMIVDWMLTRGLINNRLRYQNEVKNRNVIKIAHKYHVDLDYSQRVAKFALSIFDQLHGQLHTWEEAERELLWSSANLHN